MTSKHTPGPWKWSGEYTHPCGKPAWTLLGRHGLYGILTCDQGSAPQDLNDEANARLIAAAPELLQALQLVECVYRKNCVNEGEPSSVLHSMQAAIAKATGARA
ncbi:TPA: hypothetical protein ACOD97_000212 [Stenotrophomonas maltophilia]